jgi:hypothetical protein
MGIRHLRWALLATALALGPASAQGVSTVGGLTVEACTGASFIVTANSAYTANNEVGPLIALTPSFRGTGTGAPDAGGVVQSVRLNFKDAQTSTFKAYQFVSNPSASTWADKTGPAINANDVFKVRGPVTLSTADSGLGTHTNYEQDAIARAHVASGATDYWVLTTTGTPTFGSTTDVQFCATYLVD